MSSADPAKVGLTVRGLLTAILPLFIVFTGLPEADASAAVDTIVVIAVTVTTLIGSVQMLYGLARKMRLGRWTAVE